MEEYYKVFYREDKILKCARYSYEDEYKAIKVADHYANKDNVTDDFKRSYNDKATAYDFYCSYCKSNNNKTRRKDKKMFHRIGRSRMKQDLIRELKEQ